jgi:hypothetical protein
VGVINKYLDLAIQADIHWPLPENMTDEMLSTLLKKAKSTTTPTQTHGLAINLPYIHQELKRTCDLTIIVGRILRKTTGYTQLQLFAVLSTVSRLE